MRLLSDIEDSLLALSEDDPVTVKLAQQVLSSWYERQISHSEIAQMVNRLSKNGMIKWRYTKKTKRYFAKRLPQFAVGNIKVTFQTTAFGKSYLKQARDVIESTFVS